MSTTRSDKSLASTIRSLTGISGHMMDRQGERRISEALVKEVVSDGLIVDQADSGALHVSDHAIVVRRGRVGITTFRHPLLGEWRAERSATLAKAITKNLDTAYFFNQEGEICCFGGIMDKNEGRAELGFGIHVLRDSQSESYFQMVSLSASPAGPPTVRTCRMILEKVLSRTAVAASQIREHHASSSNLSTTARSSASTIHAGPVQNIECVVEGEQHSIPILRWLRYDGPAEDERAVRNWFEYDSTETAESRPSFTFKELQATLSACVFQLPQLSGRWRLEEVGDYPGFSAFTMVAVPMVGGTPAAGEEGAVRCMVLALQSNDAEEWAYEFFYAGHGSIATTEGGGCRITATLRKSRLTRSWLPRSASLETLHGTPDRLRLSSGSDLVRIDPASSDALAPAAGAAAPTSMDEEARGLLRKLVPDVLDFEQAVQAGDARRVAELLSAAGPASGTWPAAPGLLSAAGSRPDLADLLPIDSRLSKRPAAVPLVAAALAGRAEVVEVLLEHQLRSLDRDPWTLACAAACSPRAQAALLAQISADPRLRVGTCPRNHALEVLGMAGCTLVQIAVLAGGAGLARALVSQGGCRHTLATAVQSGDVEWLERNTVEWKQKVDSHFGRMERGVPPPKAGFTPLIAATAQADSAVVKCLLRHGANPYVRRLRVGKGRPHTSTAINYAQVYDQNVEGGFPVLRALLQEAGRLREAGRLPSEWVHVVGCCEEWRDSTHPAAWGMIVAFDLQASMWDLGEGSEGERGEEAGWPAGDEEEPGIAMRSMGSLVISPQ